MVSQQILSRYNIKSRMGCLIAFKCHPDARTGNLDRETTDPEACISPRQSLGSVTPFDTIATIPPKERESQPRTNKDVAPIDREQVARPCREGCTYPGKGIAIAHTLKSAYDVGRTVAQAAAPLVTMAL